MSRQRDEGEPWRWNRRDLRLHLLSWSPPSPLLQHRPLTAESQGRFGWRCVVTTTPRRRGGLTRTEEAPLAWAEFKARRRGRKGQLQGALLPAGASPTTQAVLDFFREFKKREHLPPPSVRSWGGVNKAVLPLAEPLCQRQHSRRGPPRTPWSRPRTSRCARAHPHRCSGGSSSPPTFAQAPG